MTDRPETVPDTVLPHEFAIVPEFMTPPPNVTLPPLLLMMVPEFVLGAYIMMDPELLMVPPKFSIVLPNRSVINP